MTVAVLVSLLIGFAAAGLGLWDLHKINKINGRIASVDFSVPCATSRQRRQKRAIRRYRWFLA